MEELYSDSASFGRFMSVVGLVIGSVVSIGLVGAGIFVLTKKNPNTKSAMAVVDSATCVPSSSPGTFNCTLEVTFPLTGSGSGMFDDLYVHTTISTSDSKVMYIKGQKIEVWYDPNNPTQNVLTFEPNFKFMGWLLILAGAAVVGIAGFWYWVTRKYKFAATVFGIGAGAKLI